jgi:chemotaxis response regulator CheB
MKVLVVDDCRVFIKLFKYCLNEIEEVKMAMYANDGKQAMALIKTIDFDYT